MLLFSNKRKSGTNIKLVERDQVKQDDEEITLDINEIF